MLAFGIFPCLAQDNMDGFVAKVYRNESGQTIPYRLFVPGGYVKGKQYPLIIWLHGAGGAGSDNLRQIEGDQIAGTRVWTKPENQIKHPAFVLVPQSAAAWSLRKSNGNELGPDLVQVVGILNSIKKQFNIDSKRIYVAGQSAGGYGTWNLITQRPDLFAAAIILCAVGADLEGGGDPELAQRLKQMPIWAFLGDEDNLLTVSSNRAMIAHLEEAGGKPRHTEYPGVGHNIWDLVFKEPDLVDWLFAQHR